MKSRTGNILCVIVIYNKTLGESIAFESLSGQGIDILVVDNSSVIQECDIDFEENNIVGHLHFPNNPGVSHAYNSAAEFARNHGYEWLFISDQDTRFSADIVEAYKSHLKVNPEVKLLCPIIKLTDDKILSPVKSWHYFANLADKAPTGIINPKNYAIINSGMMINVEAFFKVGGYNDNVSLDFSDFQFLERFCHYFDQAFIVNCDCRQSFSNIDDDNKQKLKRFKQFCRSLKNFEPVNAFDKIWIACVVIKRCFALCVSLRTLSPIQVVFMNYFR